MRSYTNIEQSHKLAEILSMESAEHHYVRKVCDFRGNSVDGKWSEPKYGNPESSYANYLVQNFTSYEIIPCWSLAALLNVIPNYKLSSEHNYHTCTAETSFGKETVAWFDNPVDACYEMILKLKEKNLL